MVTILGIVGCNPWGGWWPTFWIVGDCTWDGGWPSWGWWVTLHWMVGDHPCHVGCHPWDGGWLSLGLWISILGLIFGHPGYCEWPSLKSRWPFMKVGWPSLGCLVTIPDSCLLVLILWLQPKLKSSEHHLLVDFRGGCTCCCYCDRGLHFFFKYSVFLRKIQDSLQMFLILCDNSNFDVHINFVLIKIRLRSISSVHKPDI